MRALKAFLLASVIVGAIAALCYSAYITPMVAACIGLALCVLVLAFIIYYGFLSDSR